jgi:hypothetical protein
MARDILKSNNSIVIAGQKPAFTTADRIGSDMSGAYMSAVQSVGVGFSQQRQKSKQVGSKGLAINDITRMPDVDLSISYYYTPAMLNENMLGLINDQTGSSKSDFFSAYDNQDQNFYIVNHQNQGSDMIVNDSVDLSGLTTDVEVVSIGNAFLTNYSLGFSVGSLPIVSTSYKCSNIRMEKGTFDECDNPAINLQSGNNQGVGLVQLENAKVSGFGDYTGVNRFNPPLCSPTEVNSTLQNLQIGGAPISGDAHLQSFSFNIPINRVDLFGLGSDYPYGRKVQYPLTSSVSVEFLVSGLATGEIANLITAESGYDFNIEVVDTGEDFTHTFSFSDLKLESSAYNMAVNNQMTYSLSFSHEITN